MFARAAAPVARALGRRHLSVGDKVPYASAKSGIFAVKGDEVEEVTAEDIFAGKNVVVFGLPGAFTPVCSASHLPGYIADADAFKALGVDEIICVTPNDKFVTKAWAKDQGAGDKVTIVADGNTTLAKALGQPFDMHDVGFGHRSNRFAMHLVDGEVKVLNAEANPGEFEISNAATMLKSLRA